MMLIIILNSISGKKLKSSEFFAVVPDQSFSGASAESHSLQDHEFIIMQSNE